MNKPNYLGALPALTFTATLVSAAPIPNIDRSDLGVGSYLAGAAD